MTYREVNMKNRILKTVSIMLFSAFMLSLLSACQKGGNKGNTDEQKSLKIGVLREDDTSDEARTWEEYLKTVGKELNMTFDFTTTNSSS